MDRRSFLKYISTFAAALAGINSFILHNLSRAFASQKILVEPNPNPQPLSISPSDKIGEAFEGEELVYDISFWLFKKAAVGKISLKKKDDGSYAAVLQAETLGVIGFVTRYRRDIYIANMYEADNGKRFITTVFDKTVTIGSTTRRTITNLDYQNRLMKWKRWKGDKLEEDKEEEILPDTIYDDPLAAFYNFRFGAYGPIEEGREYHITTFPKNDVKTMYIRLATKEERSQRIHGNPHNVDYLADIKIDKELFGSQTGNVEAFFTKELIPIGGVVKDLIFFGDVKGNLIEMKTKLHMEKKKII